MRHARLTLGQDTTIARPILAELATAAGAVKIIARTTHRYRSPIKSSDIKLNQEYPGNQMYTVVYRGQSDRNRRPDEAGHVFSAADDPATARITCITRLDHRGSLGHGHPSFLKGHRHGHP
jgi:predicted small secreted protein